MIVVHSFCFLFSVRCGSLIIGTVTLIQVSTPLIIAVLNIDNDDVADYFVHFLEALKVNQNFINALQIKQEINTYMLSFIIYLAGLMFTSILLLFGSYYCRSRLLYPFLIVYGTFVLGAFIGAIAMMLYLKANNWGLGNLILYSNLLIFFFLFYLYKWVVVYSLAHIIDELKRRLSNNKIKKRSLVRPKGNVQNVEFVYGNNNVNNGAKY